MVRHPPLEDLLFEVLTPLGFRVRVTRAYWEVIINIKHPAMAGRENDVKGALQEPSEIRQSKSDNAVYLFYRPEQAERWVCAVARRLDGDGFLITTLPDRRHKGGRVDMAQVKVFYDEAGNTLTVWFGNPQDEYVAEETGDEVILMKDKAGNVIGFEKLNFAVAEPKRLQVAFETIAV